MSGHGQKLTRKQEAAIAAQLTAPTLAAAAVQAGIGEATLRRWQKRPEFQAANRAARRQLVDAALAELQGAAGQAVQALVKNLTCGNHGVETRAALGILEHATRAGIIADLAQRLEDLERRQLEKPRP
jgi:hypothetical protein